MLQFASLCLLVFLVDSLNASTVEDANLDVTLHARSKRYYLPTRPWPDKVLPYVFDPNVTESMRHKYRGFMKTIEKHTCLSFFEKETNHTDHSVAAPNTVGYVYIHNEANRCYVSSLGYSDSGRRMSACTTEYKYSHEFGHLLGLAHIIETYERNDYLNMMLDNAGDYYRPNLELASSSEQAKWKSCDFSPMSVMMLKPYAISRHEWPSFNYLYPNPGEPTTRNLFNFFKEVNIVHGCCDMTTCESTQCANEGYTGPFEGRCQCVCPPGLDPSTNCTSTITSRRTLSWPTAVTLLAPVGGCPDNTFVTGTLMSEGEGNNELSTPNTLNGTQTSTVMQTDFCTKKDGNYAGSWGPGNYCFHNNGITCEDFGFYPAKWRVNEADYTKQTKFTNLAAFPEGNFTSGSSLYRFCCRNDGVDWNQLNLPNDNEFLLLKAAGYPCQKVEMMSVREEYFIFDQDGPSTDQSGDSRPDFVEDSSDDRLTVRYCRYEPLTMSCGGMYNLDSNTPQVNISTPDYPGAYSSNMQCNWAFVAPKGSSILLSCGNVDLGCGATFKIRKRMFGEADVDVFINEGGFMLPVLSIFNKMMLTFESGQESCSSTGFQCTLTLAPGDELPYTARGEDYCGVINYAVNENGFHECIPWSEVFENSPDTYVSPEHLTSVHHCDYESNYCRNVAGDRLKPFCATSVHKGNVTLQYCDLGQFIKPFDVVDDCSEILRRDPYCYLRETRRVCFKTCDDNNLISNFPDKETPAKDVACSQPTLPQGTTNLDFNSAGYSVGTKIKVKCDDAPLFGTLMCLSNGQWSRQQNFCEGCPPEFHELSGNCYKGINILMTGLEARAACGQETPLVWPENQDEFNLIINYRDNYLKTPNSKIWFGMHTNTTHWFLDYDNSLVKGAYMWKNNEEYGIPTTGTDYMPWLQGNNAQARNLLGKIKHNKNKGRPICKSKLIGGANRCNDKKPDCASTLVMHPKLSQLQYAGQYCAYTVGKCNASTCCVPAPAAGVVVSSITVWAGSFVTYKCATGYTETGKGNHARACKKDGTLTGQELVCVATAKAVTQFVTYPMQDSVEATKLNEITTGPSVYLTVKQDSTVKACRAYCRESGDLKIQFWAPGGSPKHFTLKSEQAVRCVGGTANIWEFDTPLSVSTGQFLGVYDLTGNLIPRHNCYGTKNIAAAYFVRFYTVSGSAPAIGETFQFSLYPKCYVIMADCALVPDTYTEFQNLSYFGQSKIWSTELKTENNSVLRPMGLFSNMNLVMIFLIGIIMV